MTTNKPVYDINNEGIIIRLKEFFKVDSDEELASALNYSRSSISTWRHSGMSKRTAKKISRENKELSPDFILYGGILSGTADPSDMSSVLLRNAKKERLPYLIAHIQSLLSTKEVEATLKALFEIDTRATLEKNKPITLLSYEKNTLLPLSFLKEILANKGFCKINYNQLLNYHELIITDELYNADVNKCKALETLFPSYELNIINEVCEKLL